MDKEIIIVGSGASGLMCAVATKSRFPKAKITLIEQLEQVGKKLLATGNGRCNFSNLSVDKTKYFGDNKFIEKALSEGPISHVLEEFENLGLSYTSDETGRLYPASYQAQTILKILLRKCNSTGIKIVTSTAVLATEYHNSKYKLTTNCGEFHCDILVLANGGKSGQSLGSNGSGYFLAKSLGHTITPTFPAIVQLKSSSKYPKALKGTRVKASLKLDINGKIECENSGEILFTDYGLSGICIMEISRFVSNALHENRNSKIIVLIDLIPQLTEEQLLNKFKKMLVNGFEIADLLIGILPVKLAEIIAKQGKSSIEIMASIAKNWELVITDTLGLEFSQVTCGGVDTNQIDPTTMMSKINENLYIIGELINVDGACGGFNLHWAWLSGIISGRNIAKTLNRGVSND